MHNETILCLSNRAWHSLWGESQKLMSRIARQNRVLFFEPGRSVNRSLMAEVRRNLPFFFKLSLQKLHENLIVIPTPATLPVGRRHLPRSVLQLTTPLGAKVNSKIMIRHVKWAMKALAVKDPILWLYSPYQADLVGQFNEKLSCYHNYDEFYHFVHNKPIKELIHQFDNRLSRQVDLVFTTSRAQWQRRKAVNNKTFFVPNGVDFDLFNRALDPTLPLPADISNVPSPIIGFAGVLGHHIDVELLVRVAEAYPHCSIVLVGPDQLTDTMNRQKLKSLANVYFLGLKKLDELPNYVQAFDAALIPYLLTGHVLSGYPQKLHEYLSAGRAIVAVAMPELRPYCQVVRIAETQQMFVNLIREALDDNAPQVIQARVAVAQENTWDHRVEEIYRHMQPYLNIAGGRIRNVNSHVGLWHTAGSD